MHTVHAFTSGGPTDPDGRHPVNWQNRENVMLHLNASCTSAAALACLAVYALGASPAGAHQAPTGWTYPWARCSNMDCQEVEAKSISEKPQGYVFQSTGEVGG